MIGRGVLIIGASGFIGSAIGRKLREEGFAVTGVARGRCDDAQFPVRAMECTIEAVAKLVSELRPIAVIHAAGPASVQASLSEPDADFNDSVVPFQRLLEGVRRSGLLPRVAYLSSAAVYGDAEVLPIPTTAPVRPVSPYGHHKAICETLAAEYATCFGVPSLILRIFSVFGAEQRRLLIWDLFQKFRADAQVVVDGTGEEARDYIHVDDLAEQLASAMVTSSAPRVILNVGSGRSVTVQELARLIGRLLGSSKNISFTGRQRVGDPREWRADMSSYEALSGKRVSVDFERRLEEVLQQWHA